MNDFVWDEIYWVSRIDLDDLRLAEEPVELVFDPEGRGDEPLTKDELDGIRRVLDRLPAILQTALQGIRDEYPQLQSLYGYQGAEVTLMPDLQRPEDLYPLIDLRSVFVHGVDVDPPPVGLDFGCRWDQEHGLGVLTQGDAVLEVGGADVAFAI